MDGTRGSGGVAEPRGAWTPARIVALSVIAVLVAGLGYLRFDSEGTVTVPAGAAAGDLELHACTYATEAGSVPADCGTLVVPENHRDPGSRLIALPVVRIHAESGRPTEPVFWLEGGPGLTNMAFPEAGRINEDHEVVLVGYRGIDGSARLDCPEVVSMFRHSADFIAEETSRAFGEALGDCAQRLRSEGFDLTGYTLAQRVDDLEAARTALGYERVDLISESVGTRTAMIYAWRYPEAVHRSVMIGVNPPGHFLWDPRTTDEQIEWYAELCSQDEACSSRTDDLAASIRETAADMPDRFWFLPIHEGNVRLASFYGLAESTMEIAPLAAPMTLDAWIAAEGGDLSGLWFLSFLSDFIFSEVGVYGDYAAVGMQDAGFAEAYYAGGGDPGSILGNPGTDYNFGSGSLMRAWPANPARDVYAAQSSEVETLLIGGNVDIATPPQGATEELLPLLSNGHQVVLEDVGHTESFWFHQPEAGTRLITRFFETGEVDESLYERGRIDFEPTTTNTALGKGFAVTMVVLPLIAIGSLVWMALRVRRRGHLGRISSAIVRSAFTLVLGLGGWFLGVLLALTTMPAVPIDTPLLTTISVGVPIGVGVYLAWPNRDRPSAKKTAGFAAAMGGALVGAWLGFTAVKGLGALLTAIVGAAAGSNLAVIVLDIVQDRRGAFLAQPADVIQLPEPVDA